MYTMEENNEHVSSGNVAPKQEEKPCFFVRVWNWIKNLFK